MTVSYLPHALRNYSQTGELPHTLELPKHSGLAQMTTYLQIYGFISERPTQYLSPVRYIKDIPHSRHATYLYTTQYRNLQTIHTSYFMKCLLCQPSFQSFHVKCFMLVNNHSWLRVGLGARLDDRSSPTSPTK